MKFASLLWLGIRPVAIILFGACGSWAGTFDGLYFETKGTGEPVVLLHGGQMDRRMWDAQFDLFATQYRVIRYDIRGFGKSEIPSKGYNAGDLDALLNHLGVKKASLIGLSLGAAVAVDFALVHSERVDSLLLVCPGLGGFSFQDATFQTFTKSWTSWQPKFRARESKLYQARAISCRWKSQKSSTGWRLIF